MPVSSRKFLIGVSAVLFVGALIGWIYGRPDWGLLVAALLVLFWQIRQLLSFNRALHTGDFDHFRFGEGIWQTDLLAFQVRARTWLKPPSANIADS